MADLGRRPRWVLDTNVVIAALRSPRGASAAIIRAARHGTIEIAGSTALMLEYAAVCARGEHAKAAGLTEREATVFADAVISLVKPVEVHFRWRPQLIDPGDEMVLEAAINCGAEALVTFNLKDFGDRPQFFGIRLLRPDAAAGLLS
jgi:putative PIN family toxin of toxin-antitoxin system